MPANGVRHCEATPIVIARYRAEWRTHSEEFDGFTHLPLNEHLVLTLGRVDGEVTNLLSTSELDALGIDFGALLFGGLGQLLHEAPEPEWVVPGLALFAGAGASGRMMFPLTIWNDWRPGTALVVAVPTADRLYATIDTNTEALSRLADELQALADEPSGAESLRAFRLWDDVWAPWAPTSHPLNTRFEQLAATEDLVRAHTAPGHHQDPGTDGEPKAEPDSRTDRPGAVTSGAESAGADAEGGIGPVVISRVRAEHSHRLVGNASEGKFLFELLNEHLAVGIEARIGPVRCLLRECARDVLGMDAMEFVSSAVTQMSEKSPEPSWIRKGLALVEGPNATAWMLCPEKLEALVKTGSAPVVAVPFSDKLYVTGDRETRALEHLADILVDYANEPEGVESVRLFRFAGSEWQDWKPFDKRLRRRSKNLAVADLKIQANRQAGLQQVYGDVIPASVHPATVKMFGTMSGEDGTMAVWAPEPVALPRVDAVAFLRQNGLMIVRWKDAEERFSDLLTPLGTYPERFLTNGYPSKKQLDKLASHVKRTMPVPNVG